MTESMKKWETLISELAANGGALGRAIARDLSAMLADWQRDHDALVVALRAVLEHADGAIDGWAFAIEDYNDQGTEKERNFDAFVAAVDHARAVLGGNEDE